MNKSEYRDKLAREIELYLTEMRDGCNDCLAIPGWGYCPAHEKEIDGLIDNQRKWLAKKRAEHATGGPP